MRIPANKIAEEAAQWVARLDREGDHAELRAQMHKWAAGDDRCTGALLRAEAAWHMLDKSAVLGAVYGDGPAQGAEHGGHALHSAAAPVAVKRRRVRIWGGAAAGLAAALALMITPYMMPDPVQHIETALGEIRRVPLADGSLAAVNTDTKVEVALKAEQRHVMLARGEAWFQVAKDAERPFVVEAGDVRVRAVGTAFSVQKHADDAVDVRVTEGVVEVWRVGDEANVRRVEAGVQVSVAERGRVTQLASLEPVERALSWRDGQLIFDGDTVEEAAEKFNRYNSVKIEIANENLRSQKMIGRFRTNEPQAFVRSVAALLGAKVDIHDGIMVISSD